MKAQTAFEQRRPDYSDKFDPLFRHPPSTFSSLKITHSSSAAYHATIKLQSYNLATLEPSPIPPRKVLCKENKAGCNGSL